MPVGDLRHIVNSFTTSVADAISEQTEKYVEREREREKSTAYVPRVHRETNGQTFNEFGRAGIGGGSPSYS